jgi:hypothetical protein
MITKKAQLAKMVSLDMPSAEYHADPATSAGDCETVHKRGVYALRYSKAHPKKPTNDMKLGTLTHTLVLEPDQFGRQYVMIPKLDQRNPENKKIIEGLNNKAFQKNLIMIDQEQLELAQAMAKSVLAHPLVQLMMKSGSPEVSYFWEKDGHKLKARPDWVNGKYWMDLKTARDATRQGFIRACADSGYHRRASFYIDCAKYHGDDVEYVYVMVNKTPPYQVGIYTIPAHQLDIGRTQYTNALVDLHDYDPADSVYGFSNIIESVELPDYALN